MGETPMSALTLLCACYTRIVASSLAVSVLKINFLCHISTNSAICIFYPSKFFNEKLPLVQGE